MAIFVWKVAKILHSWLYLTLRSSRAFFFLLGICSVTIQKVRDQWSNSGFNMYELINLQNTHFYLVSRWNINKHAKPQINRDHFYLVLNIWRFYDFDLEYYLLNYLVLININGSHLVRNGRHCLNLTVNNFIDFDRIKLIIMFY